MVGSSIARGVSILVHKSTEFDAMGWVYPGRTASQINSRLERLPLTEVTVIQAGTNDIQSKSVEECKHAIKEVVSTAANHPERKTIIMCTIPQRYDEPKLNSKIDLVNEYLEKIVSEQSDFLLLRHDLDAYDFKRDGLHFNKRGVAKFAHEIRHMVRKLKSE